FRGWMHEWFYVLTTPVRQFSPRRLGDMMWHGMMEVLSLLRLARQEQLGADLVTGGWEFMAIVRASAAALVATVVGLFWLLVWLPWGTARACYHGPIWTWYFLRTRTKRQLLYIGMGTVVV